MDNRTIAERLTGFARFLETKRSNLYRVQAYRRAAETVLGLDRPVEQIVAEKGRKGLQTLPGIGSQLSFTIENLVRTGELRTLQRKPRKKAETPNLFRLSAYLSA